MSWSPHRISRSSQERARAEEAQYAHLPRQLLSYAIPSPKLEKQFATDTSSVAHNSLKAQQLSESSQPSADNASQPQLHPLALISEEVFSKAEQAAMLNWIAPLDYTEDAWYVSTLS